MKHLLASLFALLLVVNALGADPPDREEGFVSMFNGTDLTGWESKPDGWWVEDGMITSQSTKEDPCVKHHYLYWTTDEPADFILRLKYKVVGGNSGVQFRSERRPNFDTWGYQADMEAGKQWTGCLFQHGRGGVVMRGRRATISEDGTREEEEFATAEELQKQVKPNEFNDYEIIARGSKVTLRINGQLMCEVDDRDTKLACHKGIIALQMHPGPPMKVQFKDLRIKMLE